MENIHNPERQAGESQLAYRHRQRISRALASRGMLISRKHTADAGRRAKRDLTGRIGARQVRKLARNWRALDKAKKAAEAIAPAEVAFGGLTHPMTSQALQASGTV